MEKLLKMQDVQEIVGFSRSQINDMVREKTFPAPVRIGASIRWPQSQLQEWIQKKIKESATC